MASYSNFYSNVVYRMCLSLVSVVMLFIVCLAGEQVKSTTFGTSVRNMHHTVHFMEIKHIKYYLVLNWYILYNKLGRQFTVFLENTVTVYSYHVGVLVG